ncbi:MAG: rRNA maturation RNase YbeY [Syntrophus sp. (in: bacteria)]|nr:rRNA maturation RNase YbeY [Syntrophus sp. (in: bacteria)]
MAILIKNSQKLLKINIKSIKKITGDLIISLNLQNRDLSILFVDNGKITALNKKLFAKDRPTNVISFSYMDGLPGEVLGDIIISIEKADEEARSSGTAFYERLFALIVHGLTHIMGYDHEAGGRERRRMQYREKRLMAFIAVQERYVELISERS